MRYFYPRPPGGGRHSFGKNRKLISIRFLSTPSGWRATKAIMLRRSIEKFLSTPSGWRATPDFEPPFPHIYISIHALRVEGDQI